MSDFNEASDKEVSMDSFESSIVDMDSNQIDEFSENLDYEKFIVLAKKDLTNFCRIVEPLTKITVDEYGKSVQIMSVDKDTVELKYINNPYIVSMRFANKSGKQISTFYITVSNLKKLVTNAYTSLVFEAVS